MGLGHKLALVAGAAAAASGPVGRYAPAARPVAKESVVKRGDPVQLMAGNASFSVSRMMIADEDGAIGETIRVREDKKSSPVLAQIVDMGVVRIPGFNNF